MKTAKIVLRDIKQPDGWSELAADLGLSEEQRDDHFAYDEYASIEIEVDENLRIVGGRVLRIREAA